MRSMTKTEMEEFAASPDAMRQWAEGIESLPPVKLASYLRAEGRLRGALDRQRIEVHYSGRGNTRHLYTSCASLQPKANQAYHWTRSTSMDLSNVEGQCCKSCLRKAESDPDGINLLAWSRLTSLYSQLGSASHLLEQVERRGSVTSTEAVRAASLALTMRSLIERLGNLGPAMLTDVTEDTDELIGKMEQVSVTDSRDEAMRSACLQAMVQCGTDRRGEFCGAPSAPAFMNFDSYYGISAGTVALRDLFYRVRTGTIRDTDEFLRAQLGSNLDVQYQAGPKDWRHLPATLAYPVRDEACQSVEAWMLANWQAEFSATAEAYIAYVAAHAATALDSPALPLRVSYKATSGGDDAAPRAIRDLLQPFGPQVSPDGKAVSAVVPAVVAGAVLSHKPNCGKGVTVKVTAIESAHAELVSTALSLFAPNTDNPLNQLAVAFQLAVDTLGVDIQAMLRALPSQYHRYHGVSQHLCAPVEEETQVPATLF